MHPSHLCPILAVFPFPPRRVLPAAAARDYPAAASPVVVPPAVRLVVHQARDYPGAVPSQGAHREAVVLATPPAMTARDPAVVWAAEVARA
ncbi:MAG: hypothetical protein AAF529_06695, partial [Pseudomonadota bacterium]